MAVGLYAASGTSKPFAERWDGSSWSVQPVADPGHPAELTAVSCASDAACTAVGFFDPGTGVRPLAERWDGSGWSVQHTPSASIGMLDAVSCPAADACMAVGSDQRNVPNERPLAEMWDGHSWTLHSPNNPLLPQPFRSISCRATTSACTAVGAFTDQGQSDAARWDGSKWTPQAVQQSQTAANTQLWDVDCPSSDECVAVGWTTTFAASVFSGSLGEAWDRTSWKIEATPQAVMRTDNGRTARLFSVSCPERGYCVGVGDSQDGPPLIAVRQNLVNPIPTTEPATHISSSRATLRGTVDRNSWAVSNCHFEWGTTNAYGHTAPCVFSSPGSSGPVSVRAGIRGLSPATTYHYRLDVFNLTCTCGGADMAFTPAAAPPGPTSVTPAPVVEPQAPLTLGSTHSRDLNENRFTDGPPRGGSVASASTTA